MKTPTKKLPEILTESELARFCAVISNERDMLVVDLAIEAALRESEILLLEKEDVLLAERVMRIRGKGGSHKEVPVSDQLFDSFLNAGHARPVTATHNRVLWDRRNPAKKLRARRTLWKMVKRCARLAGIPHNVTFHSLRHTALTRFQRSVNDLKQTQVLARHKLQKTTADTYIHLTPDDLRENLNKLDRRPRWKKWWAALRPSIIPDFFKPSPHAFHGNEIFGRAQELAEMRQAYRNGRPCILVADPGIGRRTLLTCLFQETKQRKEHVYAIEGLKPPLTPLLQLCKDLQQDGLVDELPTDLRSVQACLNTIRGATKDHRTTLFIYDLEKADTQVLQQLANSCVIFSATTIEQKSKVRKALFAYHEIEVAPLDKTATALLAEKAMEEGPLFVPNRKEYLDYIYRQSGGNARAILSLIEDTRATGELEPEYLGRGKERSGAPIVYFVLGSAAVLRYSARSTGHTEWTIFLAVICLLALAVATVCKIYTDKPR